MEQSGEMKEVGCCLCGDVGFSDQLLPCPVCRTRSQHTYCSTMYPKIDTERWQCEWCLHKHKKLVQQQQQQQQQQRSFSITTVTKLKKRVRDTDKGVVAESRVFSGNNNRTSKKKKLQRPTCNNSSSPRSVVRRYKLLADVLC